MASPRNNLSAPLPADSVMCESQSPEILFHNRIDTLLSNSFAVAISLYPSLLASPMKTSDGPPPTDLEIKVSQSPELLFHSSIDVALAP